MHQFTEPSGDGGFRTLVLQYQMIRHQTNLAIYTRIELVASERQSDMLAPTPIDQTGSFRCTAAKKQSRTLDRFRISQHFKTTCPDSS